MQVLGQPHRILNENIAMTQRLITNYHLSRQLRMFHHTMSLFQARSSCVGLFKKVNQKMYLIQENF
jgi:hypothetical protein